MRILIVRAAFMGSTVGLLVLSLVSDFMGQEAWLKHVAEHWIDSRISGPIETVLLVLTLRDLRRMWKRAPPALPEHEDD